MIKRDGGIRLSARLQALADLVSPGSMVADVGCDHGFLDIYLIQSGRAVHALAMDVRKGPLEAAASHVRQFGLEDHIEIRLSDGLAQFRIGEAQTLVCAGMGGPLMQKILTDYPEKTGSFRELILQPQSEIREFRVFLRQNGYILLEERILREDGKYYFPMKVCRMEHNGLGAEKYAGARESVKTKECDGLQDVYDRYGEKVLMAKDPLLKAYLTEQKRILDGVRAKLLNSMEERTDGCQDQMMQRLQARLREVDEELIALEKAFEIID